MKKFVIEDKPRVLKKVQLRGGFSDRNNIDPISKQIQFKDFDERTRRILFNKFVEYIDLINNIRIYEDYRNRSISHLYYDTLENVYCNDMPHTDDVEDAFQTYTEDTIKNDTYDAVLTLIEYVFTWTKNNIKSRKNLIDYSTFIAETPTSGRYAQVEINEYDMWNQVFEQECIGYRFVNGRIVNITDQTEISEIETAASCDFDGCKQHINNAVAFLADRSKKDYKNCIKESISAVESVCSIITGKPKATLGDALKLLESKRGLKGQLKSAFEKLYNYTNDKGGIRHAEGLFVSEVTFEEAKFMLVCCSAFVNYLIAEYGKIDGDEQ